MTDEWLQLKLQSPIELRRRLANKVMLVEDFLERFWDSHPHGPDLHLIRQRQVQDVFFHGHCHQKALWGQGASVALLHRLMGDHLHVLDSGCCGMAGSFGYFASKYKLSMRIGELSVFPPLRQINDDAIICAPGTSCRHQIHDGTGRRAVHPIELVHDLVLASRKS
jgi:Fe-S oxidoreductase